MIVIESPKGILAFEPSEVASISWTHRGERHNEGTLFIYLKGATKPLATDCSRELASRTIERCGKTHAPA
jgi:hypothetical protein